MIICPWCGTAHLVFQSNCKNCGGPLQASEQERASSDAGEVLPTPALAPRPHRAAPARRRDRRRAARRLPAAVGRGLPTLEAVVEGGITRWFEP